MRVSDERLARAEVLQLFDLRTFSHPCAVTLTMKKRSQGEANDPMRASRNFRHFCNVLNRKLFGSKFKRFGVRIQTIAVIESNAEHRLHFHAVLDRPEQISFRDFETMVKQFWQQTKFGYTQVDVQDAATPGWTNYMLKYRQKDSLLDSIDWDNCQIDRCV